MAASSALLSLLLFSPLIAAQRDNAPNCECFQTNGSSAAYFTSHRFHDYRNVASPLAVVPQIISDVAGTQNASVSSSFFSQASFTQDWDIQTWNNSDDLSAKDPLVATVLLANSKNNVYIEPSLDTNPAYSTYLTLRTNRVAGFQGSAELNSQIQDYQYLSARFLGRVRGPAGACAGFFTYRGASTTSGHACNAAVQEVDIEILTRGPRNRVQLTNQPALDAQCNDNPKATANVTIPGRDWTEWTEYRMDWLPDASTWYINGVQAARITYQVPKDPSALFINMWSNGGQWSGNMSEFDAAYLQIQWIDVAYNVSAVETKRDALPPNHGHGPSGVFERSVGEAAPSSRSLSRRAGGCKVICSLDATVTSKGTPATVASNTGAAGTGRVERARSLLRTFGPAVLSALVFGYLGF